MAMHNKTLRPRVSGFNPKSIAGLQLWLDAADSSTISTGTGVSEWRDKSATGSKFVQATGNDQPATATAAMNGRNVLVFDGTSDSLSATTPLSTSMPLTMFFVQRIIAATQFGMSYTSGTVTSHFDLRQTQFSARLNILANSITVINEASGTREGVNDILAMTFPSSGDNTIYRNGSQLSLISTTARPVLTGTHYVGRRSDGFYANIQVAEIIAYSTKLSDTDRRTVEAYLGKKWGITVV